MIHVSSTEPKLFHALGPIGTMPERFGMDFLWSARGELWGVQRKTWEDLAASLGDRIVRQVAQAERVQHPVLIIEGRLTVAEGVAMIGRQSFRQEQLWGLLWSMRQRGWWVEHANDVSDTAMKIRALEVWSRKERHSSLEGRKKMQTAWGTASARGYALWVLQSLPGVGPETAKAIWEKYGLPFGWRIGLEELQSVEGVGPKKARKMFEALGGTVDD